MKCVVIEKPGVVTLKEKELAPLRPGFARIKVMAAAICAMYALAYLPWYLKDRRTVAKASYPDEALEK